MSEEKICTGLDIGTNSLIAARLNNEGNILYKMQRDAFFEIKPVTKVQALGIQNSLDKKEYKYMKQDGSFFIVGKDAVDAASDRRQNTRRPMQHGILSSKEAEKSGPMIKLLIKGLIGEAREENEPCFFTVPAQPMNGQFDIVYHESVVNKFLKDLGYAPEAILEAEAIVFSELIDDGLTGMALSFGAGMVNVSLMSLGESILSFSIPKSGDWVDEAVARTDYKLTATLVQQVKEQGVNLLNPDDKIEEAISFYFNHLFKYVVECLNYEIEHNDIFLRLSEPITMVVAGGGTLAEGFLEKFKEALDENNFQLPLKDVRYAEDKMNAIAKGCLMAALM